MDEIDYYRKRFHLNADGKLFWRKGSRECFKSDFSLKMFNGKYEGKEAGAICDFKGIKYKRIKINNKNILAHRIVWAIHYGEWPEQVDHINGDGLDNRIENLRSTNNSGNQKNRSLGKNNLTGILGVHWFKRNMKWGVIITSNGHREFIGLYEGFFEACCARKSAENRLCFHRNHGRKSRKSTPKRPEN